MSSLTSVKETINNNPNACAHLRVSHQHLKMGLSKKRKQQLKHITSRSLEIRKKRKVDRENKQKNEILRRQREEEDHLEEGHLDKYEYLRSESKSNEPNYHESSQDRLSFNKEDLVVEIERGDSTRESLRDDDGGVQLGGEERALKPTWRGDAGGYLRGVRGCGSSATKKRAQHRKKDLEKSASQTRSIVGMFSAQLVKKSSQNSHQSVG